MVEYIAHTLAVVYVCTGDGLDKAANEVAGCLLVMQAVLVFDFGSRTEMLAQALRPKAGEATKKA